MNRLFITGMGRSGTTLIEKLLSSHQDIDILSQPFPLVFTYLKKNFLNRFGIENYYNLNDNPFEGDYNQRDFINFLFEYKIDKQEIINIFNEMKDYSGQLTKINYELLNQNYSFINLYDELILRNLKNDSLKYYGSKEIMCDEYIPYLLEQNFSIILIIRDPRDVIASINYPKNQKYLGEKKPILFLLENWRRSVRYSYEYKNSSNFIYLKYEDLVSEPYHTLEGITKYLDIDYFGKNFFDNGIYDRNGKLWKSNTSYNNQTSFISSSSVGSYRKILSQNEINYIESVCKNEIEFMGYNFTTNPNINIIKRFRDHGIEESIHLDKNYSSLTENIEKEVIRFNK